jgi:hypothetical protein
MLDDNRDGNDALDEAAQIAEDALPAEIVAKGMSKAHANAWLRVTDKLYSKLGRPVRPSDFVAFAKKDRSRDGKIIAKLIFHVSKEEASQRYYQLVAAHYCRVVRVVVSESDAPVRAIVRVTEAKQSGYAPLSAVENRPDLRQQVLADAARELRYMREKFASMRRWIDSPALARAFAAIDTAISELGGP